MRKAITVIVACALFSGCATLNSFNRTNELYGIKFNSFDAAKDFKISINDKNYELIGCNPAETDRHIIARGYLPADYDYQPVTYLNINIINYSNNPISTNYFRDRCSLKTLDGKLYILEKPDITGYHSGEYINPSSTAYFTYVLPPALRRIQKEQIDTITLELGEHQGVSDKSIIVLKQVPK